MGDESACWAIARVDSARRLACSALVQEQPGRRAPTPGGGTSERDPLPSHLRPTCIPPRCSDDDTVCEVTLMHCDILSRGHSARSRRASRAGDMR